MSMKRAICLVACLALAAAPAALRSADDSKPAKKRLLVITESKGFRHNCVARQVKVMPDVDYKALGKIPGVRVQTGKGKDGKASHTVHFDGRIEPPGELQLKIDDKVAAVVKPCLVEATLVELGKKDGLYDAVCSQDSRAEITAENLKGFDAVFFYTTGELPLSDTQKADLIGFVKSGKGFAGSHSATDTFYKWPEYGKLIGGYFDGHPWHQKVRVVVEDTKHPATKHLGETFEITDEIYQFKGPYDRKNLRVLMHLEMKGLKAGKRQDQDNALAWVQDYGKGRVFYTALGHRDEVWKDERFQKHMLGGLSYAMGLEKADATPLPASDK